MLHQWFTCVHLLDTYLANLKEGFQLSFHYSSVSIRAAQSGLQSVPVYRMRWVSHHLFESYDRNPSNIANIILHFVSGHTSRCKVTTLFPKNNGFQILWQHVADSCSGCLGCICSKGAILAVILHPKGKAMDSASISFREEQGLMFRKGLDFPNSFHSGWDSFLRRLTSIHPKRIFMSSKT